MERERDGDRWAEGGGEWYTASCDVLKLKCKEWRRRGGRGGDGWMFRVREERKWGGGTEGEIDKWSEGGIVVGCTADGSFLRKRMKWRFFFSILLKPMGKLLWCNVTKSIYSTAQSRCRCSLLECFHFTMPLVLLHYISEGTSLHLSPYQVNMEGVSWPIRSSSGHRATLGFIWSCVKSDIHSPFCF